MTGRLRFLADESCDFGVVRALRAAGHDVVAVCEVTQRSDDSLLMKQAANEHRILLTEDKDFGWLYHVSQLDSAGVILIRFPGNRREGLAESIARLVHTYGDTLVGRFTVLQPGHVRISPPLSGPPSNL